MLPTKQKYLALALLFSLFSQQSLAQTWTATVPASVRIDGSAAPASNLSMTTNSSSPLVNNITSVAPGSLVQDAFGASVAVPAIAFNSVKPEGPPWHFQVDRQVLTLTGTRPWESSGPQLIRHDETPPLCPPAPTEAEYTNGTDYYTVNGLQNPWPQGLNGEWSDGPITFNKYQSSLCRDQITNSTNGRVYVERIFQGSDASPGNCTVQFESLWGNSVINTQTALFAPGKVVDLAVFSRDETWLNIPSELFRSGYNDDIYQYGYYLDGTVPGGLPNYHYTQRLNLTNGAVTLLDTGAQPTQNSIRMGLRATVLSCSSSPAVVPAACSNPASPPFYYTQDTTDCEAMAAGGTPSLTLPANQMADCRNTVEEVLINSYGQPTTTFPLVDRVGNITTTECPVPFARIDGLPPVSLDLDIEHIGLGLPRELMGVSSANPTNFRADDGQLILHADFNDVDPATNSGRSGINWEALTNSALVNTLQNEADQIYADLRDAENDLRDLEADMILARGALLWELSSELSLGTLHNLWLHTTGVLLPSAAEVFQQKLNSVNANRPSVGLDDSSYQTVINLLNTSKFDAVTQRDALVTLLEDEDLNFQNSRLSAYSTSLNQVLNSAQVASLGSNISTLADEANFSNEFNQWQIDKYKNYSLTYSDWVSTLSTLDTYITSRNSEYQGQSAALSSGGLASALSYLQVPTPTGVVPASSFTSDIQSGADTHLLEQNTASSAINQTNSSITSAENYLRNFDVADTFSANTVNTLLSDLSQAKNAISSLNSDVDTTVGIFGYPVQNFDNYFNGSPVNSVVTDLESFHRQKDNLVADRQTALDDLLIQKTPIEQAINVLQTALNDKRSEVGAAIEAQADAESSINFLDDKITHLEIERIASTPTVPAALERFFPPTTTPVIRNEYEWNLNQFTFEGESLPIFANSGLYRVTLRIYDQAGNETEQNGYITINPAELEPNVTGNCNTAANRFADMVDTCDITVPHIDKFGNVINSSDQLKLEVRGQDVNGSYDLIAERGLNYLNGVRFVGGSFQGDQHVLNWTPGSALQSVVQMRTLLPTITVIPHSEDPSLAAGFEAENGLDLPLTLTYPQVDVRGFVVNPAQLASVDLKMSFKPWLGIQLSDRSGPPSEGNWAVATNTVFPVVAQASTGIPTKNLPPNFNFLVTGVEQTGFELRESDGTTLSALAGSGQVLEFRGVSSPSVESGQSGQPGTPQVMISPVSALSGQTTLEPLFIPAASYAISDAPAASRTIVTPGVPIGVFTGGAILPDPNPPEITGTHLTIAEEGEPLFCTVTLSKPATQPIELFFDVQNGTAENSDYTYNNAEGHTIDPGVTSIQLRIPTVDDEDIEDDETLSVVIDSFVGTLGPDRSYRCEGTITDNDNTVSLIDTVATEGEICQVGVSLHHPVTEDITVEINLGVPGDGAEANVDYDATPVMGIIPAGSGSILLPVPTIEDQLDEADIESFTVLLNSVSGGGITSFSAESACDISDDDVQANLNILSNTTVTEGERAQVTVTLVPAENEDITLRLETVDQDADLSPNANLLTADSPLDFIPQTFDLTIPAGTENFTGPTPGIQTLTDALQEDAETFGVQVVDVIQGTVGDTGGMGVVTVLDNTPPVVPDIESIIGIGGGFGVERNPGDAEDQIVFNVLLSDPNADDDDLVMVFALEDISAEAGTDYNGADITVTIPSGSQSGFTDPVNVLNDTEVEETQTFRVVYKSTTSGVVDDTNVEGIGTIIDDDVAPADVFIEDALAREEDPGSTATIDFAVHLGENSHFDETGTPLELVFQPVAGGATAGSDFVAGEYSAIINVGQSIATAPISVPLIHDEDVEDPETFTMEFLRVESGHTVGDTNDGAEGTILDDDVTPLPDLVIHNAAPVSEGGNVEFTASLTSAPSTNVRVEFTPYSGGDATAVDDYDDAIITAEFTTTDFTDVPLPLISTVSDADIEGTETFTLEASRILTGALDDSNDTGEATILDVVTIVTPDLIIHDAPAVTEGTAVQFTASLTEEPTNSTTVEFRPFSGGNAVENTDYSTNIITASFTPANFTNVLLPLINTTDNTAVEGSKTFTLEHHDTLSGSLDDTNDTGEAIILNDDTPPVVTPPVVTPPNSDLIINDAPTVTEGDGVVFTASLIPAPAAPIEIEFVPFSTGASDATSGDDYSGSVIRRVFDSTNHLNVTLPTISTFDDATVEDSEGFSLRFGRVVGAGSIGDDTDRGRAIINDNDVAPPVPELLILDAEPVTEGGLIHFNAVLTENAIDDVTVRLRTRSGSATNPDDYVLNPNTITLNIPSTTLRGDLISVLPGVGIPTEVDNFNEGDENFFLDLQSVDSGTLSTNNNPGEAIIEDVFNPPSIFIDDVLAIENQTVDFSIWLDRADHNGLDIDFDTIDGTALRGDFDGAGVNDYECDASDLSLTFAPGDAGPKTVTCSTYYDTVNEPLEDFTLVVDDVVSGAVAPGGSNDTGQALIRNIQHVDIEIEDAGVVMENDPSGVAEFTVNVYDGGTPLATALEAVNNLTLQTQDITAIGALAIVDGIDYLSVPLNALFNPGRGEGSTTTTVQVPINDDEAKEFNPGITESPENRQESFIVTDLMHSSTIRTVGSGEGIIQDEDRLNCDDEAKVYIRDGVEVEGDRIYFDVSLSEGLCPADLTLTFRTTDSTADSTDYDSGTYTVTIPRRAQRPDRGDELYIDTTNDALDESDEQFQLEFVPDSPPNPYVDRVERKAYRTDGSLQDLGQVVLGNGNIIAALGTIIDDDTDPDAPVQPDLLIEDSSATEGDLSTDRNPIDLVVRLSEPNPGADTRVRLEAATDTATRGTDFLGTMPAVTIPAGEGSTLAQVSTIGDTDVEGDETLLVRFVSLLGGVIDSVVDTGLQIILDNDTPTTQPVVLIDDATAQEGDVMEFRLHLQNPLTSGPMLAPTGGLQFTVQTQNGSALNNDDFQGGSRTVTIPGNNTQRTFSINTIDDSDDEGDENFSVRLQNVTPAGVVVSPMTDTAIGTIIDNDSAVCDPVDPNYFCCLFPSSCLAVADPPGADIEGQILVDESLCSGGVCSQTDTEAVMLGTSNTGTDIREEITRNAYSLIRGSIPDNEKTVIPDNAAGRKIFADTDFTRNGNTIQRWDIYLDDLPEGGVTYLNGAGNYIRIGMHRDGSRGTAANPVRMSGNHTIVVVNGSLNIVGDIVYDSPDDSLGVIVLSENLERLQDLSRFGQITVFNDIQTIVGAYFTEGSFVSNWWVEGGSGGGRIGAATDGNPANDWDITNGNFGKQLILTGNLLSRNTLGAADLLPPKDPWGQDLSDQDVLDELGYERAEAIPLAQMYDLNYIRRYVPDIDPITQAHLNADDCAVLPGESTCYGNTKSFIMRIDPRLRNNPPPGFGVQGMTKLR